MMYYFPFLVMTLFARPPVEKFLVAKKWNNGLGILARAWIVYLCITLNDLVWFMWG